METKSKSESTCCVDDKYLFIGLTNGALKNKDGKFVKYIESIFSDTKSEINNNLLEAEKLCDTLYKPLVYNIFGDYDYAFLALSDDFHFGAKGFRPYAINSGPAVNLKIELPFQYQSIFGPHIYKDINHKLEFTKLQNLYNKNECISITQVKLNNILLIGGALDFLHGVIGSIYNIAKKHEQIQVIVTCNYSWNELTVVSFSKSFAPIFEFINDIRNIKINGREHWYKESLHKQLKGKIKCTPIIKETNTKFGYKYDVDNTQQMSIIDNINTHSKNGQIINYVIRVHTKPERTLQFHKLLRDFCKTISKDLEEFKVRYVSGRATLTFESKTLLNILHNKSILNSNYLRKISTFLEFDVEANQETIQVHKVLQNEIFKKLEFNLLELNKLKDLCNKKFYPKMATERIIRLFLNYNQNVSDPSVFNFFMELRKPLEQIKKLVESNAKLDILDQYLDSLENAFWNRYYHTPQFIYNSDSFTEYSGGILQILSAYHYASNEIEKEVYKNIIFDQTKIEGLYVNITTKPGIESSEYCIDLNFYHLFQPVLFTAVLMHESFNFFQNKFKVDEINSFHLNKILPNGDDNLWTQENFEYYLNHELEYFVYFDSKEPEKERSAFYSALSSNVFRWLAIDLLTLKHAYLGNWTLFLFWHFGSIFQDIKNFDIKDEAILKEGVKLQLTIRFLLVYHLYFKTGSNCQIQELKDVLDIEGFEQLNLLCKKFIIKMDNVDFKKEEKLINSLKNKKKPAKSLTFESITDCLDSLSLKGYQNDLIHANITKLRPKDSFKEYSRFINEIKSLSFSNPELILIQHRFLEEFHANYFSATKFDYNIHVKHKDNKQKITFNPQGGLFTKSARLRNKILKLNVEYYFKLWNKAQKSKLEIFDS